MSSVPCKHKWAHQHPQAIWTFILSMYFRRGCIIYFPLILHLLIEWDVPYFLDTFLYVFPILLPCACPPCQVMNMPTSWAQPSSCIVRFLYTTQLLVWKQWAFPPGMARDWMPVHLFAPVEFLELSICNCFPLTLASSHSLVKPGIILCSSVNWS